MGILARIKNALSQRERVSGESGMFQLRGRTAGVIVSHDTVLTVSAIYCAVKVISETLAVLNWHVFRSTPGGGKERADDLRLYDVLRRRANPEMSAFQLKLTLSAHLLLFGNAYAEIQRDLGGRVIALWPMMPDRMTPRRAEDGELFYEYQPTIGAPIPLPASSVLHVRGLGFDGLRGYDVVTLMARTAGTGIASESFQASFFANGTHVSGGLFHPKTISTEARQRLKEEWTNTYQGPQNSFKMAVFEEGMEWRSFQITPEQSQMIEARRLNIADVSRFFRIPLHKLGDLERATFSNIEEQNVEFLTDTIMPLAVNFEQEADVKLLGAQQRNSGMYTKFNMQTLLRGRQKDRYEAYKIGREWGWLSANDVREMEDLDPLEDEIGGQYIVPLNFQLAERMLEEPEPEPEPPTPGADDDEPPQPPAPPAALRPVIVDAAERIARREHNAIAKLWAKHAQAPAEAFAGAFSEALGVQVAYLEANLHPVAAAMLRAAGAPVDGLEQLLRPVVKAYERDARASWTAAANARRASGLASVDSPAPDYRARRIALIVDTLNAAAVAVMRGPQGEEPRANDEI